jgi:cbb3-type cytochrome oxidase maturation protein
MKDYFYLIPIALCIGITALATFMWSLKNGGNVPKQNW